MLSLVLRAVALFIAITRAQDSVHQDISTYGRDDPKGSPFQTFQSNPSKPPQLQINSNSSGLAPGYVFMAVGGEPTSLQRQPVIFDMSEERMGTMIWSGNYSDAFDFRAQTYQGEPVLTFWAGAPYNGWGDGSFYILNASYVEIAKVEAVGYEGRADLHEFNITPDDTAMVLIYPVVPADLSPVGGAAEGGYIFDSIFQEVNISTGELIFEWKSSDHIPLNESYNLLNGRGAQDAAYDYFHINSADKDADGNYLISARTMDCIYKINGSDGSVIWRLGGKLNDFDLAGDAKFALQHDARWISREAQDRMTLFDNGPTENITYSRGLLLAIDQDAMTARLEQEFENTQRTFGTFQGSLQAINPSDPNTNFMIGYGSEPYFAEFDSDGNELLNVQFGSTNAVSSYRVYKLPWEGRPLSRPDFVYDSGNQRAYLSWNGATAVETWGIYTADTAGNASAWGSVMNVTRTGFETTVDLSGETNQLQAYVIGHAFDVDGNSLAWSRASDGRALVDASTPETATTSISSGASPSETKKSAAPRRFGVHVELLMVLFTCLVLLL